MANTAQGGTSTSQDAEITTMQDLYLEELQDLYSAETQLIKALPKMAKAATTPELKQGFETHLQQTQGQAQRLEQILQRLNQKAGDVTCKAMQGLIAEGEEIISEGQSGPVLDAALIGAAQKVEHYEIAGYGTVITHAKHMGDQESIGLLQQTLAEEKQTDEKLTQVAESLVNPQAKRTSS